MIKIGFDIGGVLSKYPEILIPFVNSISKRPDIEVHILSDMHPQEKILDQLKRNGLDIPTENVHSCDYQTHGELCKAIKCHELDIGIMMDDFMGYIIAEGAPLRLLVMPDPQLPYFADEWQTDGSEGDFGRRKK